METFPFARKPQRERAVEAHSYLGSGFFCHFLEYAPVDIDEVVIPLLCSLFDVDEIPTTILPGEYVPAHATTQECALFLKTRVESESRDTVFVPDSESVEGVLPHSGKGTICSVICSDESCSFVILYARQRGAYRRDTENLKLVFVRAISLIEERVPREILCNGASVHKFTYPNRFNLSFNSRSLKTLLRDRYAIHFDSIDLVELTAIVSCLLSDEDRWHIAESRSVLEQLIIQMNCLQKSRTIVCGTCGDEKLCSVSDLIIDRFHHYLNPHYFLHRLILARRVENVVFTGQPSIDCSWFPGYGWQVLYCTRCSDHVGWKFSRIRENSSHIDPAPTQDGINANINIDIATAVSYDHDQRHACPSYDGYKIGKHWCGCDSFVAFRATAVQIK